MSTALRITNGTFGRVVLLNMDRPLVRHAHPHCHVLLKVEGADTRFLVRNRFVPLTDENAVLVNAWEPHAYEHHPDQPKTVILALYIEPAWLGLFRSNWSASGAPDFFADPAGGVSRGVREHARSLAAAMVHAPDEIPLHEDLLGKLMIALVERFAAWRRLPDSVATLAQTTALDFRIRKAILQMRHSPGSIDDMSSLARSVGLSRPHFFRLFEGSTGVSPRVYLNVQRIEAAIAAVAEGEETMTSISHRLGFSVPAHFSRFFHDHAGSSPTVFRQIARLGRSEIETPR
jgi:AraC family transcriptional regulator